MSHADLYVSERAAKQAAIEAVNAKRADSFTVRPQRQRNADRPGDERELLNGAAAASFVHEIKQYIESFKIPTGGTRAVASH